MPSSVPLASRLALRLFDPSGKLVAATLNKDFTLEIPDPPSSAPSSR